MATKGIIKFIKPINVLTNIKKKESTSVLIHLFLIPDNYYNNKILILSILIDTVYLIVILVYALSQIIDKKLDCLIWFEVLRKKYIQPVILLPIKKFLK